MLKKLKQDVCDANIELYNQKLAPLTWGNVSGILRDENIVVIKPSGVPYEELAPDNMAVVDLDGDIVEKGRTPSTDVRTHLELYRAWPEIGGVTHTHSVYAAMFAQASRPIPCFGTTHADYFRGEVPITRPLAPEEVNSDYERNTGVVIVERFKGLVPLEVPGILVDMHGPFTWGEDAVSAFENSLVLELVAKMAMGTLLLNPDVNKIPEYLREKHYLRKHGPGAYYGQGS